MRIAFNPSTVAALTTPPNNKDITFDLRGRNIFARGVKFYGTDTNTWRDIKVNNVSISSHTLDLRNGGNTTLTNTNGVVTINSTWRPVVDNLTSNSTTSSLSANQGRVLKALIDGKSDSGHNHDGRYVRYYAVTTLDCNNLAVGLTAARVSATNAAHTNNSVYLYISDIGTPFQIQIPDSNVPYIYKRYYSSGKWSGWFKLNAGYADSAGSVAWANITGKPSSYTPSAHTHAWNSLTHSSTTENQAILTNGKANGWKLYTLNISGWNNAANNAHSHSNKSVLDGITSGLVNNWNTAYNFVHTITGTDTDKVINKWDEIVNFLAGITEDNKLNTLLNSKLSVYELADKTNVGTIKNNGIYYSTTDASSGTLTNSPFNTGFALINMTSYDGGDDLRRSRLAFNAYGEIKVSDDRDQTNTAETWYNVLTSKNSGISGSTIKLNGTSITVYSSGTTDGRYVKKSGDTMTGVLTIDTTNFGTLTIKRNDDANGASIQFRGKSSVYGYIGLNNSTKDKQFLRWNSDTSKVYTILDTSSTYTSSGKGVINGTTITQVDNATNATNSTNARKLVNWYSARPTSLNAQFGDGSLRIFHATSSTTEGKPAEDSHILHLAWDNTGGWDAQLAVHIRSGKVSTRAQSSGTWQPWKTLAFTTDIPSSLKNPHSLTLKANGTTLATYDGSSAKEANFTYANVGAASASHTHSYYAVNEIYGGFKKAERLPTSGFYQSVESESGGNAPWTGWMHLINCQHSNTTNNYALQIAASFFNNNIFKIRVTNNSVNNAWRDIIHSGNIGSQSVNYANSAGNSDKVDGYHATSGSNKPWGTIPVITTSGWMDIGKHLEFHFDNTTGSDYSTILRCTGNHSNIVNLPSVAGTLALISDIPSSVKNPYSLTTFGVVYDGSSAKVVSPSNFINQLGEGTSVVTDGTMLITSYASNSGFADTNAVNVPYKRKAVHLWEYIKAKTDSLYATKNHNHDGRYVYNYGGTAANGQALNQNALFMSTTSGITGDWWHILQAAWNGEYRWNSQIAFPTQNRNGMYYRSGLDDNTKWGSWVKLLDVNNYSSTLDSRYYTESEVNSLLSKKLNTSDFNWTNLPGKLVAGNEFNIVNAGFKEVIWFNYLPINDRSNPATINSYHFGNGNKGYTSIIASGFIKSGGNASQLLRADGGVAAFNWSGQTGQPTWLWGGNSQHSYYVYNPSNFRVAYAADSDKLDGKHASDFATAGHNHDGRYVKIWGNVEANFNFPDGEGHSGVYMCHTTKTQSNKPETYGLLTDFSTVNGHLQFFGASSNKIYARTYWWTGQDNFKYTDWHTLLHTGNSSVSGHTITINGTSTTWSDSWRPIGTGASDAAAGNHTHKVKINGSEKIITATNAKDVVDLGTYLTSHQSLAGYVNTVETIGAGNAVTSIVKAGGKITANKGTTFLTSHQSLANYYTKGQVDAKLGKYLPLAGGTMNAGAQIQRTATGGIWYQGRSIALLRETSANGYHALWSLKTTDGSWDFGEYNSSDWNNIPVLSYVLDSNFDKGSNTTTYQIKFPLASGTIALTSNIPNPTNYYWANNKITSTSKIDAEVRVKNLGAGCSTTIENTIIATNWVRAMGSTGIYFQDHGGGLYMSDNTWIRTWAGKALQVDNTIRSTDFNTTHYANNVWTITSAAKLENPTTLVYGTSTSANNISTYLRGTNITLQVKKGTSINYNALQLTSDRIYCNNYFDMKYGAEVSGDHFTVQSNSYLAQLIGSKVGIGTKNPQYVLDVGDKMRAGGYVHSGHNSNDAMLLAGGGWKKLSTLVEYPSDESYIYRKTTTEYDIKFVKLVNFNNLIYVDGWINADANGKSFTLGDKFKPYLYKDDHSMPTIVQMGWDDTVAINGDGKVEFHIEGGRKKRIGFFYTGRA